MKNGKKMMTDRRRQRWLRSRRWRRKIRQRRWQTWQWWSRRIHLRRRGRRRHRRQQRRRRKPWRRQRFTFLLLKDIYRHSTWSRYTSVRQVSNYIIRLLPDPSVKLYKVSLDQRHQNSCQYQQCSSLLSPNKRVNTPLFSHLLKLRLFPLNGSL